jgi:hypothetical protein
MSFRSKICLAVPGRALAVAGVTALEARPARKGYQHLANRLPIMFGIRIA